MGLSLQAESNELYFCKSGEQRREIIALFIHFAIIPNSNWGVFLQISSKAPI